MFLHTPTHPGPEPAPEAAKLAPGHDAPTTKFSSGVDSLLRVPVEAREGGYACFPGQFQGFSYESLCRIQLDATCRV